jgi:hypothetical protein
LLAALSVNVGSITFRTTEADAVRAPETPVIVTVACPTGAVLLAVKVTVDVFVVGLFEKAALTPVGRFAAESETLPEKPFKAKT